MSRPLRSSSAVGFFLSTTVIFDAARRACLAGHETHFRRTENYNLRPGEVLRVLQLMENSCFGMIDRRILPAAQFLAPLAVARGAKIIAPREQWPSATQLGSRSPSWAVTFESRRHAHHDNLLADMREFPPAWNLSRTGPLPARSPLRARSPLFPDPSWIASSCFFRSVGPRNGRRPLAHRVSRPFAATPAPFALLYSLPRRTLPHRADHRLQRPPQGTTPRPPHHLAKGFEIRDPRQRLVRRRRK